jgi:hypothetical protein
VRILYYCGWLTPELCRRHANKLFVFGDNLQRFGMGGQAIIRNEANSFGIATKRLPSMHEGSFFFEDKISDMEAVLGDLKALWNYLKLDPHVQVVIPVTSAGEISLGLERAQLKERAPSIYATIVTHIQEMAAVYGGSEVLSEL